MTKEEDAKYIVEIPEVYFPFENIKRTSAYTEMSLMPAKINYGWIYLK
jgi:hypothetical protein